MSTPVKIVDQNLPTVALVGRVNVGKSTLYNKLTETTHAIVSDIPGTTRTRNIGLASWRGKGFRLIDTGGLTFSDEVPLEKEIIKQTEIALQEADLILFVVDVQDELLPQEKELAKLLRKNKKPVMLVANKADSAGHRQLAYSGDWLKLGLGEPVPVSAQSGAGLGDLLDIVFKKMGKMPKRPKTIKKQNILKVAIIGRPNVGKSSLFNKLIGEDRVIVSDLPHTTREPHDTLVSYTPPKESEYWGGEETLISFVDTAGIRKKTKVHGDLERQGVGKSIDALNKADMILFVIDANSPLTDQDKQLGGLLREHTKSVIIVVNKWDLSEDNSDSFRNETKEKIYASFPHLDYAPIIFVSAKNGYRTHQIFPLLLRAAAERQIIVPEDELSDFFKETVHKHKPAKGKGVRHPKILGFNQVHNNPPIFEMAIKSNTSVHSSYAHYVANRLREKFSFFGSPIIIRLKKIKRM